MKKVHFHCKCHTPCPISSEQVMFTVDVSFVLVCLGKISIRQDSWLRTMEKLLKAGTITLDNLCFKKFPLKSGAKLTAIFQLTDIFPSEWREKFWISEGNLTIFVRTELHLDPGRNVPATLSPQTQHPHTQIMQLCWGEVAEVFRRWLAHRLPVLLVLGFSQLKQPEESLHWEGETITLMRNFPVMVTKHVNSEKGS